MMTRYQIGVIETLQEQKIQLQKMIAKMDETLDELVEDCDHPFGHVDYKDGQNVCRLCEKVV